MQENVEDIDQEKNRPSYKQTKQSEGHILKLITDGKTLVTNVKVAGESKEVIRRQEEEEARRARYVYIRYLLSLARPLPLIW